MLRRPRCKIQSGRNGDFQVRQSKGQVHILTGARETSCFLTFKMNELCFGGLDVRYRAAEMGTSKLGNQKEKFTSSPGKQIRTKNEESIQADA